MWPGARRDRCGRAQTGAPKGYGRAMRRGLALAVAVALLAVLAPAASAGVSAKRDRGAVPGDLGLSKKERRALDIASVRLFAQDGLGLVAVVVFKGNVERALGRGHLEAGAVAMVLNRKRGRGATAGLVTLGDGEVLARARSRVLGVVRSGRRLTFFVKGGDVKSLRSVEVRSFAADPRKRTARQAQVGGLAGLAKFAADDGAAEADEAVIKPDLSKLSCKQLEELLEQLEFDVDELDFEIDDLNAEISFIEKQLETARPRRRAKLLNQLESAMEKRSEFRNSRAELIKLFDATVTEQERRCGPGPPEPLPPPPDPILGGFFDWDFVSAFEIALKDARFQTTTPGTSQSAVTDPITAVKVVLPPADGTPRAITNMLCPAQLPMAQLLTTTNPNDTLVCSGGSLPVGTPFNLNVQTSPAPTAAMGGQMFGYQEGTFKGPFAITGP